MKSPLVIAVVVNWNQPDYTIRCVQSLRESDYRHLRVIVVDNGSSPAVYARLRDGVRGPELIRSEVNLGFGAGSNLAIRRALASNADHVLVTNNDTVVDSRMISRLVEAADRHPEAGLIGPLIHHLDRPERVWLQGYRSLTAQGVIRYLLRRGLPRIVPGRPVQEIDFLSGCCALIPRSVLEEVGLFAEEYFMYYEDVDLCMRVKRAGRRVLCVTDARMWHAVGASSGGEESLQKQYYQTRSGFLFYRTHSRGAVRALHASLRIGHAAVVIAAGILRGRVKLGAAVALVRALRRAGRIAGGPGPR